LKTSFLFYSGALLEKSRCPIEQASKLHHPLWYHRQKRQQVKEKSANFCKLGRYQKKRGIMQNQACKGKTGNFFFIPGEKPKSGDSLTPPHPNLLPQGEKETFHGLWRMCRS
jgi:hypothetical protein